MTMKDDLQKWDLRKLIRSPYAVGLLGVLVIVLVALLGISQSKIHTEQSQVTHSVGELLPATAVGQTFIADYDGLASVGVKLGTYTRDNTGPLVLHLLRDTEEVVTVTEDAADVEDLDYLVFEFSPVLDSAGGAFYFYLEAPEAEPGNAITVFGYEAEDIYADGTAVFEGLHGNGVKDLAFRLDYQPPLLEKAGIVVERLAASKPSLWGDRQFYLVLGLLYLGGLYGLFVQFVRAGDADGGDSDA